MQLMEWLVGLGGRRALKTNEMLLQHLPEYDEVSQILPLAKISPCCLVVPNFRFARQRERGELHRTVFWFEPDMVEF